MQWWILVEMIDSARIETTWTTNNTMDLLNSSWRSLSQPALVAYFVAFFQKKFSQITSVLQNAQEKQITPFGGPISFSLTCPVIPVISATWRFFASLATGSVVPLAISTKKSFFFDHAPVNSAQRSSRAQGRGNGSEASTGKYSIQACAYARKGKGWYKKDRERERGRARQNTYSHMKSTLRTKNARNSDRKIEFVRRRERRMKKWLRERNEGARVKQIRAYWMPVSYPRTHKEKRSDNHVNHLYWHVMNREHLTSVGSLPLL